MKSIYSLEVLQRIIDHWHIGKIEDVTYFENVGQCIWRHFIYTNQGTFELYSYPATSHDYAKPKLQEFLISHHSTRLQRKEIVHSFENYHVLINLEIKLPISPKQAYKDLDLLIGLIIKNIFRVYGTILQIHLNDANVTNTSVLSSYGIWSINDNKKGKANVIVHTHMNSKDQLDEAIGVLKKDQPKIAEYILKEDWFELYLSNGMSIHFKRDENFPAIRVHIQSKKNSLQIFNEHLIYYTWGC